MTPEQLAKTGTEHAHQKAFFAWANIARAHGFEHALNVHVTGLYQPVMRTVPDKRPELALMHAIPNGGSRNKAEAAKLKAEGVKAGVLDVFLPVSKPFSYPHPDYIYPDGGTLIGHYNGLYIEFKKPTRKTHKDGGLSTKQCDFMEAVRVQGYCARVAYTWKEAANLVMLYYGVDTRII